MLVLYTGCHGCGRGELLYISCKVSYIVDSSILALMCIAELFENNHDKANYLNKIGKVIINFVSYEYSEVKISLEDKDPAHCCKFGVNKGMSCSHGHSAEA